MGDKLFGRYRSLRRLLASPAGEVHLAQMEAGGHTRKVVLKILHPPATSDRVDPFLREARATAPTLHQAILRPLDFGQAGEHHYVAIEPLVGVPLSALLAAAARTGRRVSFDFVASVASQVCAGLAHAHSRQTPDGLPLHLVHSDISPDHLLVCEGGQVKMVGFAMARGRGLEPAATRADRPQTSAFYVAPEVLQARREPDGRADLFSLGAVLWEAVAGKPPFVARTLAEIADAFEQPAVPLTLVAREVPLDLADAVSRALEFDPSARYASAEEMRRAFDGVLARRGAHNPSAVVDAELKGLLRHGLALQGFEGPKLPPWFTETLGFDPQAGPLPTGTALEGGPAGPRDDVPTQIVESPAPSAGNARPTAPATPAAKAPLAVTAQSPTPDLFAEGAVPLSPDDAWGAPPAQPRPGEGRVTRITDPHANVAASEAPPRRSRAGLALAFLFTAAAFGAGGLYAPVWGKALGLDRLAPASAAPAATPSGHGVVEIVSVPPGGKLEVDGAETGLSTPARVELDLGRKHLLRVRHPEFVDWALEVEAQAGQATRVEAGLVKAARVVVKTEPPGAQVEIGDAPGFSTPGRSGPLAAGPHKVVVKKPGFLPEKREVVLRGADEPTVSVTLVPAGEVQVKSAPSGADVFVDGEETGMRTPATVPVAAGKPHAVSVRKPGWLGQARRIEALEPGKSTAVDLALEDLLGPELGRRAGARIKERAALERKRDEARKRLEAKRTPANEKAFADLAAAVEQAAADIAEMQVLLRGRELVRP